MSMFPSFVLTGGTAPLAGTHFQFLREIPKFARYEVRSQVVGWDHKWLYIVHRFVSHRKLLSHRSAPAISNGIYSYSSSLTPTPSDSSANLPADAARAAAAAVREPEPDGATLHCISVNVTVFKYGRITVPPALVLAGEGLGATHAQGVAARGRAVELREKGMRELYRGAWRAVPKWTVGKGKGAKMFGDLIIPEETQLSLHTYSIHRDPRNFHTPEAFLPKRWLSEHNTAAFLAFSHGPTKCVGKNLALMELHILLCWVLRRFRFSEASEVGLEGWDGRIRIGFF